MKWLLVVLLYTGTEWLPAYYTDTWTPVTHAYETQSQCVEEAQRYNTSHDILVERAQCIRIP